MQCELDSGSMTSAVVRYTLGASQLARWRTLYRQGDCSRFASVPLGQSAYK